ncbi:MAG: metalloregulator ArsR/SmtB family transcription factor [Phycisphaeraceae bacterium]|nr:metalloregulator ArsR/SmtB family transcription factor [Phycisphaeraceae bacterium]
MIRSTERSLDLLGWMDSLADETRLRLLHLMEQHELGVVDLCDVLQMPQSTVSRHLKVLGDQGWCRCRRQGTANLYRMSLDELEPAPRRLWILAREQTESWSTLHQDQLRLQRRLRQRREASRDFFDNSAEQWDKLRSELYGQRFDLDAQLALLPPTWVVADLGCGAGAITASLARHVGRVIGVDQSAAMLKSAKLRTAELNNVELRRGNLESLPIDDASCDGAVMVLVLTYLADPAAAVKEIARILKPGGRAAVIDLLPHDRDDFRRQMDQHWSGLDPKELSRLMTEAGLSQIVSRDLPPEPETKGPALFLVTATR